MTFDKLSEFINQEIDMAHIFQSVMIRTLLDHGGECTQEQIAMALLQYDVSQFEYYKKMTNNVVGRVLRKHGVVVKDKKIYRLVGYISFTQDEKDLLISQCDKKLKEYVDNRGEKIWSHRKQSPGNISGSLKYEVLKKAGFHCELCGVSADVRSLEVDHIVPRNKYGTDDINNLQALCYICNSIKQDTDATDFREFRNLYNQSDDDCIFCHIDEKRIELENKLAYLVEDMYPVTDLHRLIIPKRHVGSYFELSRPEINSCHQLLADAKKLITTQDHSVEAVNIGINDGETAGQTIPHCHIHIIPRRRGDVGNPRGGIRNIIPGKGDYKPITQID